MIEQLKATYEDHLWFKIVVSIGLLSTMVLFYELTGGFPPWPWRFLLDVLPRIPQLWQAQGTAMLLPLAGLMLYALSLLMLWVTLVTFAIKLGLSWFQQDRFAQDVQAADELAQHMAERIAEYEQYEMEQEDIRFEQPQMLMPEMAASNAYEPPLYAAAGRGRAAYPFAPAVAHFNGAAASTLYPVPAPPRKTRLEAQAAPPASGSIREQLRIVPPPQEDDEEEAEDVESRSTIPNYGTIPDLELDELEQRSTAQIAVAAPQDAPEVALSPDIDSQDEQVAELRLVTGIGLDPGLARKYAPNEDSLIAFQCMRPTQSGPEPAGLFVVADGMGGHANGQEASRLAIQTISEIIVPALLNPALEQEVFLDLLKDGVHRANLAIYQRNRQQAHMMGTTMTAALVIGSHACIANVGDSRTYLYRETEGLKPVTRDHSLVASLVEDGIITAEEVYTHPKRNQIFRCLGEHSTLQIDIFNVTLQPGDLLLLCSDGLWEMVRDRDMEDIIRYSIPHSPQISSALVQAALNRGGADNISIIAACLTHV